jgi:NAD(P)-dependent dehydrogenase (short-subunit alcohol dehydrogenase family)
MTVAGWDFTMALLLRSAMLGIKHAAPVMKASGGGSIVNTSSIASFRPEIGPTAYSIAKAGINQLTRMAAIEFAPYAIRVNAICPGVIPTPSVGQAFGASREAADQLIPRIASVAAGMQPMGRAGSVRDIAEACLFLGSDAAGFITGRELVVDGGLTIKGPEGYRSTVERIAQTCA